MYVSFIIVIFSESSSKKWLLGVCKYVSFILVCIISFCGNIGDRGGQVGYTWLVLVGGLLVLVGLA